MKLLKQFILSLLEKNKRNLEYLFVSFYRLTIFYKAKKLRSKPKIKVLFILNNLSKWKTEELFKEMLNCPRFQPIIGTAIINTDNKVEALKKNKILLNYLGKKGYKFVMLNENTNLKKEIEPDIIIYQEPYYGILSKNLFFQQNIYALFIYAHYGYYSIDLDFSYNCTLHWMCWQVYYENDITLTAAKKKSLIKARNGFATGLPMTDILMRPKLNFNDPWKKMNYECKRIIWAPHHSIPIISNYINYSIFLDIADDMLDIAIRHKDRVQIAFKPHPDLKKKLFIVWGEDKTNRYYNKWKIMSNTQLEQGDYIGLFKYSDALIHDCGSFTVEYLYMNKPVMYLENGKPHIEDLTEFGKQAYNLHYKGSNIADIENFINNVIAENDCMHELRNDFFEKQLQPPHGRTASANIIGEILKV